jgi:hypothetical protein
LNKAWLYSKKRAARAASGDGGATHMTVQQKSIKKLPDCHGGEWWYCCEPASMMNCKSIVRSAVCASSGIPHLDIDPPGADFLNAPLGVTNPQKDELQARVVKMIRTPNLKFLLLVCAFISMGAHSAISCDYSSVTGGWDFCELEGEIYREVKGITWVDCQTICDREAECQGWNSGTPGMDMRNSVGIEDEVCQLLSSVTGQKHYSDSFHSAFKAATADSFSGDIEQNQTTGNPSTALAPVCPGGSWLEHGICKCEKDDIDQGCGCPPGMINGGDGTCYCADPNSFYNKDIGHCAP